MLSLPVERLIRPADLAGTTNGRLPTSLLRQCAGGDLLHHWAADSFDAMHALAARHGIDLKLTDGYRPYETQERLFRERYKRIPWVRGSKVWNGERWWLWYGATAAVPGFSNHGLGLAVDIHTVGLGTPYAPGVKLRWLLEYAEDFGWSWELQSEAWHLRYVWGRPYLPHAPDPLPAPPPPPSPGDDDMPHYLVKPNNSDAQYVTDFSSYKRHVPRADLAGPLGFIGAWKTDNGNAFVIEPFYLDGLPEV